MTQFKHTPEEARTKWVEALRSGEYQQGKHQLRDGDGFCCLGVACDLFAKLEGIGEWDNGHFKIQHEREFGVLLTPVRTWLGLQSNTGDINPTKCLTSLNDRGYSFAELADVIEEKPGDLIA
ncbi:hypothetical protein [Inquilinus limosus]|uniref:Uncharacterized protein n=1 Tax=Inquilinus limosus MP06 TaxID=1398085 RepID=A0A0A0DGM5_9PROT|nr:hypothetical protein [Inquilinus limosus]KGM36152.1 hypothetical protein P409_00455 [Inquilinus limosus MP06]